MPEIETPSAIDKLKRPDNDTDIVHCGFPVLDNPQHSLYRLLRVHVEPYHRAFPLSAYT